MKFMNELDERHYYFYVQKEKRSLINRKQIERLRRKREGVLEDEPPFR